MHLYPSAPMYSFGPDYENIDGSLDDRGNHRKSQTSHNTTRKGMSVRPDLYTSSNPAIGPGAYHINDKEPKKYDSKTFSKGKRGHSELKGVTTVGPGSYNPKKFMRSPPNFSFGYKSDGFQLNSRAFTPGPGAYDTKDSFQEIALQSQRPGDPKSAFLRTAPQAMAMSKTFEQNREAPGPGENYNPESENYKFRYFTPSYSFGTSTRDELYNDERRNVPGPGKYNFSGTIKTKSGFTILGRHNPKGLSNDTPAPNAYNQEINPLRRTAPSFRIGKSERTNLAMGSPDIPGPGMYHNPDQISQKGVKIGTSVRPMLHTTDGRNPGPGEYNVEGQIGGAAKYSMGIKPHPKRSSEVMPGPGEYDPFGSLYLEKNNGAIIGTSERPPLYKKAVAPGPGQYDIRGNLTSGSASMIGKAKRSALAKVNDEPGPGQYDIRGDLNHGKKSGFGKARKMHSAKVNDEPGPGMYNLPSTIGNVPSYQLKDYNEEKLRKTAEIRNIYDSIFFTLKEGRKLS